MLLDASGVLAKRIILGKIIFNNHRFSFFQFFLIWSCHAHVVYESWFANENRWFANVNRKGTIVAEYDISLDRYEVALVSRIDKIIGLFCKRALQKRHTILRSLLIIVTPYVVFCNNATFSILICKSSILICKSSILICKSWFVNDMRTARSYE